jgi:hypothetical protein
MGERSQQPGRRLSAPAPTDGWLIGGGSVEREITVPQQAGPASRPRLLEMPTPANKSWLSAAVLAVLGIAALITIFVSRGSGKIAEPAPLPEAPSTTVTTLTPRASTEVRVQVGEYVRLALPAGHTYSTVVEQASPANPVIEDLKLPGQQPQLRSDASGHATVEVMSEPICTPSGTCTGRRTLYGTMDVTVTP